jgi:hypothetical protein
VNELTEFDRITASVPMVTPFRALWNEAEDGVVVGWPCATAVKYGTKVFTPQHEAETAQKRQQTEAAELKAENARLREELAQAREKALNEAADSFDRMADLEPSQGYRARVMRGAANDIRRLIKEAVR